MKNWEIILALKNFDCLNNIQKINHDDDFTDFWFALSKIKNYLQDQDKNINFVKSAISGLKNFEKERLSLVNEYSEKNKNGKPIIKENHYLVLDENLVLFEEKMTELREKYKEDFNTFTNLMNKEVEKSPPKVINRKILPKSIQKEHFDILEFFIIEEDELFP